MPSFNIYESVVKGILTKYPLARDCDASLYHLFCMNSLDKYTTMMAWELLKKIHDKELPSFDTISRIRRKLQNEYKELRGIYYEERQEKQKKVKEELGYSPIKLQ